MVGTQVGFNPHSGKPGFPALLDSPLELSRVMDSLCQRSVPVDRAHDQAVFRETSTHEVLLPGMPLLDDPRMGDHSL